MPGEPTEEGCKFSTRVGKPFEMDIYLRKTPDKIDVYKQVIYGAMASRIPFQD